MTFGFSESAGFRQVPHPLAGPRVLRPGLLEAGPARDPRLRRALLAALQLLRERRQADELRPLSLQPGPRHRSLQRAADGPGPESLPGGRIPGRDGRSEPLAPGQQVRRDRAAPRHRLGRPRQRQDGTARGLRTVLPPRAPERRPVLPEQPALRQGPERRAQARHRHRALRGLLRRQLGRSHERPRSQCGHPQHLAVEPEPPAGDPAQHHPRAQLRGQQRQGPARCSTTSTRSRTATSTTTASTTAWTSCARAATAACRPRSSRTAG